MLEYNFDGLIGPTHNFAGLSSGNLASMHNRFNVSNPAAAALQGLAKMKICVEEGIPQGFIPPQERPCLRTLRERGGFSGTDRAVLDKAGRQNFELLLQCSSASSMWTANAATVSPSTDTADRRVHLTTANLMLEPHRSIEPPQTAAFLKAIFSDDRQFFHHGPLNSRGGSSDEGAANHMRLWEGDDKPGVEVFVFASSCDLQLPVPRRYPARQSREASLAVARQHGLDPARCVFLQQNPDAIDAGVFHNDVIAMSRGDTLICHETAFWDQSLALESLNAAFARTCGHPPKVLEIPDEQLSLKNAVATYFFNSQLLAGPDQRILLAPAECAEHPQTRALMEFLTAEKIVDAVRTVDLRESMANGGGPACLRLRVMLTQEQSAAVHSGFLLDNEKISRLEDWVSRSYRDRLEIQDLRDPEFLDKSRRALDELTGIIGCGSLYEFQK